MSEIKKGIPESMSGMTAIVTGGAKGIGLGIAKELARGGCRIALWDMDQAALMEATDQIAALGAEVRATQVNVAVQEQVEAAVKLQCGHTETLPICC